MDLLACDIALRQNPGIMSLDNGSDQKLRESPTAHMFHCTVGEPLLPSNR